MFEGFEDDGGAAFVGADDDGAEEVVVGRFTAKALRRRGGIRIKSMIMIKS